VRYLGGAGGGDAQTIAAWGMLARVFENFGVVGYHLPGVLLVTVLVIWHLLLRDPWTVRVPVLVGMAMEACLWTVPLTILAMLFTPEAAAQTEVPGADLLELSLGARLTISFGAGLYEELLFRMIVIAAAHALLVDVMRLPNALGAVLAVVVSAVAFAIYHKSPDLTALDTAFYGLAGVYFGTLYLTRGFGLVVTVHTLYDVLVLVVVGQQSG
jgi:membrane protease YdiL (CAAX protease family)